MSSLFRKEVLLNQIERTFGTTLVTTTKTNKFLVIIILLLTFLFIIFVLSSKYTKKERVSGFVYPDKGLVKVVSGSEGFITSIYVEEGDVVKKNDPLFEKSLSNISVSGEDVNFFSVEQLKLRKRSLNNELESQVVLNEKNKCYMIRKYWKLKVCFQFLRRKKIL